MGRREKKAGNCSHGCDAEDWGENTGRHAAEGRKREGELGERNITPTNLHIHLALGYACMLVCLYMIICIRFAMGLLCYCCQNKVKSY